MTVADLNLRDYSNIPNAFSNGPSVGASCSFDIRWSGPVTSRGPVTIPPGTAGQLVMCQADMTWSAHNDSGFSFVSDSSDTTSAFAQLGHIQSGVFA
jgi:hypothetical protein